MGYLSHKIDSSQIKPGDHIYTWGTAFTYSHHGIHVGENKVVHFRGPGWVSSSSPSSSCTGLATSCSSSLASESSQPKSGTSFCSSSFSSSQSVAASCLNIPDCGFHRQGCGVILSCLNCFIGSGSLYLFQYGLNKFVYLLKLRSGTCTTAKSDPPEQVIHRAMNLLQNGFGRYGILRNNCEDFALYCKTGLLICGDSIIGSSGQANDAKAILMTTPPIFYSAIVSSSTPFGAGILGVVSVGMHIRSKYKSDIGVRQDTKKVDVKHVN